MKEEDFIEELKQVKRVNPPQDLFKRIEVRVREESDSKVSFSWIVAACAVVLLLVVTNFLALSHKSTSYSDQQLSPISEALSQTTQNQLYE